MFMVRRLRSQTVALCFGVLQIERRSSPSGRLGGVNGSAVYGPAQGETGPRELLCVERG